LRSDAVSRDGRMRPSPPRIEIRAPRASPEEAAAIAAAIEDFLRETAPPPPDIRNRSAWLRAGLLEGVGLAPDGPGPWAEAEP
ncbi:MAG: hypothetical protein M3N16_07015, partial [Actinomycetota bacterium]|nr:hypothetical protein [Actinomycetota bacterium]